MDPSTVDYVEAHATGTVAGDPEECGALDRTFTPNRKKPLLIGSVKSNIGHTEASSGVCSMAKMILSFENDVIPPNINFERVRPTIPALVEQRMIVCDEQTPFSGEHIAINSFGFGGANAHALFKRTSKVKVKHGIPDDDIPRLVNWSGRSEEAITTVLDALESQSLDAEFVGLLHDIQSNETPNFNHRGYAVLSKNGNENAVCLSRDYQQVNGDKLPVVWMFSGMGSQWVGMGKSLLILPHFRESIQLCHDALKTHYPLIDLISVITSDDTKTFDYIVNSYIGIAAIQIGLVNLLRMLNVPMDHCIGHSIGELG